MHIMRCNNDLLNELELITRELASSIKRELALEAKLKNNYQPRGNSSYPSSSMSSGHVASTGEEKLHLQQELLDKANTIAILQEKLNKEKRLRFISEEHAILQEHGQNPSPLKLNYEKTEIYNQLVAKNELVNQLTNRVRELEEEAEEEEKKRYPVDVSQFENMDHNLMNKIQNLQHENRELQEANAALSDDIKTLQSQREELREVISKISVQGSHDIKQLNEKIRTLELKNSNLKNMNSMLTYKNGSSTSLISEESENISGGIGLVGNSSRSVSNTSPSKTAGFSLNLGQKQRFASGTPYGGGKLNGFTIVSPNKKLFDD